MMAIIYLQFPVHPASTEWISALTAIFSQVYSSSVFWWWCWCSNWWWRSVVCVRMSCSTSTHILHLLTCLWWLLFIYSFQFTQPALNEFQLWLLSFPKCTRRVFLWWWCWCSNWWWRSVVCVRMSCSTSTHILHLLTCITLSTCSGMLQHYSVDTQAFLKYNQWLVGWRSIGYLLFLKYCSASTADGMTIRRRAEPYLMCMNVQAF